MREVRRALAAGRRAANLVAKDTFVVQKDLLALLQFRRRRRNGVLQLIAEPSFEFVFRFGNNPNSHVSVLEPAEFGALSAKFTRVVSFNPFAGDTGRNQVALTV